MKSYLELAKKAVEEYVRNHKIIDVPTELPPEFYTQRAGAFVSLHKDTELRGCIGTYLPTRKNIAEEIIYNAIAAATEDYRFNSITVQDLPKISYEIYILEAPEPIKSTSQLDPKKYGILIKTDSRKSGLLLPDLEGINTAKEQFSAVCEKCGADPESEKIELFRFQAKKYK